MVAAQKGTNVSMKKKVAALVGAVAVAGGLGIASAPIASAGSGDTQVVNHTGRAPAGLGGRVGIVLNNAPVYTRTSLAVGEGRQYTDNTTGYGVRSVLAGGGYCVWEELWIADSASNPTNVRYRKIGDFNHGKGLASGTAVQLQSQTRGTQQTPAEYLTSDLRIYAC